MSEFFTTATCFARTSGLPRIVSMLRNRHDAKTLIRIRPELNDIMTARTQDELWHVVDTLRHSCDGGSRNNGSGAEVSQTFDEDNAHNTRWMTSTDASHVEELSVPIGSHVSSPCIGPCTLQGGPSAAEGTWRREFLLGMPRHLAGLLCGWNRQGTADQPRLP
jgi:hypothetical protein